MAIQLVTVTYSNPSGGPLPSGGTFTFIVEKGRDGSASGGAGITLWTTDNSGYAAEALVYLSNGTNQGFDVFKANKDIASGGTSPTHDHADWDLFISALDYTDGDGSYEVIGIRTNADHNGLEFIIRNDEGQHGSAPIRIQPLIGDGQVVTTLLDNNNNVIDSSSANPITAGAVSAMGRELVSDNRVVDTYVEGTTANDTILETGAVLEAINEHSGPGEHITVTGTGDNIVGVGVTDGNLSSVVRGTINAGADISLYASGTTYSVNDIVRSSGHILYISITNDNTGNALTNVQHWLSLGGATQFTPNPVTSTHFATLGIPNDTVGANLILSKNNLLDGLSPTPNRSVEIFGTGGINVIAHGARDVIEINGSGVGGTVVFATSDAWEAQEHITLDIDNYITTDSSYNASQANTDLTAQGYEQGDQFFIASRDTDYQVISSGGNLALQFLLTNRDSIGEHGDVDVSAEDAVNNVLIYNPTTERWTASDSFTKLIHSVDTLKEQVNILSHSITSSTQATRVNDALRSIIAVDGNPTDDAEYDFVHNQLLWRVEPTTNSNGNFIEQAQAANAYREAGGIFAVSKSALPNDAALEVDANDVYYFRLSGFQATGSGSNQYNVIAQLLDITQEDNLISDYAFSSGTSGLDSWFFNINNVVFDHITAVDAGSGIVGITEREATLLGYLDTAANTTNNGDYLTVDSLGAIVATDAPTTGIDTALRELPDTVATDSTWTSYITKLGFDATPANGIYLDTTSATNGQIPKWNGSAWALATDETGEGDPNGIGEGTFEDVLNAEATGTNIAILVTTSSTSRSISFAGTAIAAVASEISTDSTYVIDITSSDYTGSIYAPGDSLTVGSSNFSVDLNNVDVGENPAVPDSLVLSNDFTLVIRELADGTDFVSGNIILTGAGVSQVGNVFTISGGGTGGFTLPYVNGVTQDANTGIITTAGGNSYAAQTVDGVWDNFRYATLLTTGFLLTEGTTTGTVDEYTDTNGIIGVAATSYFFQNSNDAWYDTLVNAQAAGTTGRLIAFPA